MISVQLNRRIQANSIVFLMLHHFNSVSRLSLYSSRKSIKWVKHLSLYSLYPPLVLWSPSTRRKTRPPRPPFVCRLSSRLLLDQTLSASFTTRLPKIIVKLMLSTVMPVSPIHYWCSDCSHKTSHTKTKRLMKKSWNETELFEPRQFRNFFLGKSKSWVYQKLQAMLFWILCI